MNKKIACIGARETPQNILNEMKDIGFILAARGYTVASGNAKGADEYFAKGANEIDPTKVSLYLPWDNLNEHLQVKGNKIEVWGNRSELDSILATVHKSWDKVKDYVKQLHRRNYGIVKDALCVICYTIDGTDRGGTGIGMRLAQKKGIPVFNLFNDDSKSKFLDYLEMLEKNTKKAP